MRKTLCFAAALAVFATASAHADDRSAKWVGRWKMYTETMATPMFLTLKESGGKLTGTLDPGTFGIALFKGDALRLKLNDAFDASLDCTVSLEPGGAKFEGECYYHSHSNDRERRHLEGTRE